MSITEKIPKDKLIDKFNNLISIISKIDINNDENKKKKIDYLIDLVSYFIRKLNQNYNNSESTLDIDTKLYNKLIDMKLNIKYEDSEILLLNNLFIREFYRYGFEKDLFYCIKYDETLTTFAAISEDKFNDINSYECQAKNLLKEIITYKKEIELLTTKDALSGFRTLYGTLRKSQRCATNLWLLATFGMFGVCLCVLCYFYQNNKVIEPSIHIPFLLIFSEISISLFLIIITAWCAKMYSISKSLCISYSHKSVSSNALLPFMRGIDDNEIKNIVLLEASRMIFASPDIGQSKDSKLDLKILETIKDINPIVKHVTNNNLTERNKE